MEEKKFSWKKCLRVILTGIFILGTLFLLQRLFFPKYVTGVVEGAFIKEYYEEEMDHDLLFIGDCEVYENFTPALLWEKYGYNSYIRGSAQQLIWQSYYLLEDSLRYETPDVVIFNVLSLKYNEPQKEAYNRMSLEGMKWSSSKVKAIQASMTSKEDFITYVFPLLRYHSRYGELTPEDAEYMFQSKKVSHNGYYMRVDVKAAENVPAGLPLADYKFGENAFSYLEKMTELCKEKGITLILIKAPSLYPYWYDEWETQVEEFASDNDLMYINFLELQEECGLDFTTDTYDAGLHMNLSGAEKITDYLGSYLAEHTNLPDRRNDQHLQEVWKEKLADYYADMKAQQAALVQ